MKKCLRKVLMSITLMATMAVTVMPTNVSAEEADTNVVEFIGFEVPEAGDTITIPTITFKDAEKVKTDFNLSDAPSNAYNIYFNSGRVGEKFTAGTYTISFQFVATPGKNLNGITAKLGDLETTLRGTALDVYASFEFTVPSNEHKITLQSEGNGEVATDTLSAKAGDTVRLHKFPKAGYVFKEWKSDDVTIDDDSFVMPDKDVAITGIFEEQTQMIFPDQPKITSGDSGSYQLSGGKDMRFTCTGALENLTGIYVDGKLIDEKNYTLQSGSTILTLKSNYLDTLSVGKHTLKFQYKDNLSAETVFTVIATSPKTSSASNSTNVLYMGFIALFGSALVIGLKKKSSLHK